MKRAPTTNNLRGMLQRNSPRQAARFGDRRASLMLFAVQVLHETLERPPILGDDYSPCINLKDVLEYGVDDGQCPLQLYSGVLLVFQDSANRIS
jgi:hypothetical protein